MGRFSPAMRRIERTVMVIGLFLAVCWFGPGVLRWLSKKTKRRSTPPLKHS